MDEVLQEFLIETHEGLDQLDLDLVALEQTPDATEVLGQVFRTIHTIKGSSGFLALDKLGAIAHAGENLLSLIRDGKRQMTSAVTSALLSMADAIREVLERLEEDHVEGEADYTDLVQTLAALAEPDDASRSGDPASLGVEAMPRGSAKRPTGVGGAGLASNTIRVDVALLDTLMNLVGELVLSRNQILQFTAAHPDPAMLSSCQRLDLVTTELQEGVMKTRMQPIGGIWSKLPRVVRDLAVACGKSARLEMEGRDTELDKTIIESIKDPLTHAIRNAVDHGIEDVATRRAAGKSEEGCVRLRAFHEGGQVNIEIADDGRGIDVQRVKEKAVSMGLVPVDRAARMTDRELVNLITMPGFSTAVQVTSVSGRGVGMDVVKTNIEKIGGTLDIQTVVGRGTTLRIKIPLTLAIIPALIVTSGSERFAIPQVNLLELVRIEPDQVDDCIEYIDGTPVHRLRGDLLPLAYLNTEIGDAGGQQRDLVRAQGANIVVLRADDRQFGLVVEEVLDTEEIVVKPLGKQLKNVPAFAGAAIMGDGRVALIIDVIGLAQKACIIGADRADHEDRRASSAAVESDREVLLLVTTGRGTRVAIDLATVARLEEFDTEAIESAAGHQVVQYRGQIMPLVHLSALFGGDRAMTTDGRLQVVVVRGKEGQCVGLVVARILDIIEERLEVTSHRVSDGIRGAAVLQGKVTDVLDVERIVAGELATFANGRQLVEAS